MAGGEAPWEGDTFLIEVGQNLARCEEGCAEEEPKGWHSATLQRASAEWAVWRGYLAGHQNQNLEAVEDLGACQRVLGHLPRTSHQARGISGEALESSWRNGIEEERLEQSILKSMHRHRKEFIVRAWLTLQWRPGRP